MRTAAIVLIIGCILFSFAGAAMAADMAGIVTSVDEAKGTLTLKNGTQFNSVAVSLLKGANVRDNVKVQYKDEDGKKVVTKITKQNIGC